MDGGVHKHGEFVVGVVVQVIAAAAAAAVAGRGQRRLGIVDAADKTGKRTYMSHTVITEDENRARKMCSIEGNRLVAATAAVAGRGQRRLGVVDATDKTGKRTYLSVSRNVITEADKHARKMFSIVVKPVNFGDR
jgi:hypothetical protein